VAYIGKHFLHFFCFTENGHSMPIDFRPKTADEIHAAGEALQLSAAKLLQISGEMRASGMEEMSLNWPAARERYLHSAINLGSHAAEEFPKQLYAHKAGQPNPRQEVKKVSRRVYDARKPKQSTETKSPVKKRGRPKKKPE